MNFSLPQLTFVFFFPPTGPITWTSAANDFNLGVSASLRSDSDCRLVIRSAGSSDSQAAFDVQASLSIGLDVLFAIQAVAALDAGYRIFSTVWGDLDVRLTIVAPAVESGHSVLFTVREEDVNTN